MVPKFGCYGCMQRTLLNLRKLPQNQMVYIVSNRDSIVVSLLDSRAKVFNDSMGIMDQLDLQMAGIKFIKTGNGKLLENKYIHHDSLNLMQDFIFQNSHGNKYPL